ncbi:putative N-acetyltransferase camello [Leptodactylus fuscus]
MADIFIRPYESRDYDLVRDLFAHGMMDYVPSACIFLLKRHPVQMTILVLFITFYLLFQSYLLSLLVVGALLAGGRLFLIFSIQRFIDITYKADLHNIDESYMLKHNSCFWVAEVNGEVIGMVGVQPVQGSQSEVELRRLSVAKDHQRKGIARRLCLHVIDFARQRGYKHVNLNTSTMQRAAHKLYRNMGFRRTGSRPSANPGARLFNFSIIYYTYDIRT